MEDYAPVAPVSPPRSFQEHDAPLGSSSADPSHSFPHPLQSRRRYHDTINQSPTPRTTGEGKAVSEQNLSDSPSVSQQAALTALQHYDNATIFAWLTGLRSFRPGGENWFQPRRLSRQELEAISALKDCADSLVSVWLDAIRCGGNFNAPHDFHSSSYFAGQRATVASTHNSWHGSSNTSRSSSGSFGASASPYDSRTSLSTQSSSWSRGTFLNLSRVPSIDETAAPLPAAGAHTHWCFVCENHRVFATCDGWKRHMKEHETRYPCMPQGCERYTVHGPECVLCGALNPDERHYNSHKIQPCSNRTLVARSYTRKSHLISHLKTHGISDGSTLAEEWRDTLSKKYFSCGFCIACFHSHTDQLNHIDSTHYKNHQHISEWDSNNAVLGLLLQPGVQESWQNILKVHPRYNNSGFRWHPAAVKRLQLRLEKREEPVDSLALAAFNEGTYDWIQNTQVESMPVAGFSNQNMNIQHNFPIIQSQSTPAQMLFTPNQSSVFDGGMMNNSIQSQHPTWRSIATTHLSPGVLNANPTAYENNSSQAMMITELPQNFRDVRLEPPSSSSNGWASPQPPSRTSYNGTIPIPSDVYGGQTGISSGLATGGNWQASLSPKPLSGHLGHQHNSAARTRATAATQPTSLGFDYPASPLTQATSSPPRSGPLSLLARPKKQPSRTKLKDHYGIDTEADMDIDLDDIQYFMREEGHTRSEKRHR